MEISYKDFRKETPLKGFFETQFAAWLCTRLSPLLAIPCIRYNIRPNTQTLAMIISNNTARTVVFKTSSESLAVSVPRSDQCRMLFICNNNSESLRFLEGEEL